MPMTYRAEFIDVDDDDEMMASLGGLPSDDDDDERCPPPPPPRRRRRRRSPIGRRRGGVQSFPSFALDEDEGHTPLAARASSLRNIDAIQSMAGDGRQKSRNIECSRMARSLGVSSPLSPISAPPSSSPSPAPSDSSIPIFSFISAIIIIIIILLLAMWFSISSSLCRRCS
jgi:hypothetical protein